jgi:integrase
VPYRDVAGFVERLRERNGVSALALEFLILTAGRPAQVAEAAWSEVDLVGNLWTIPGARMKGGVEHRVPLVGRAAAILAQMATFRRGDFVFSTRRNRPLDISGMLLVMRRMKVQATPHGFRSTFKDWCSECTSYPDWVSEKALGHLIGDETRQAYQRGDLLEKRRKLMDEWCLYATPHKSGVSVTT